MERWKAHYRDQKHNLDIFIENQFEDENQFEESNIICSLKMRIDDIEFCGMDFCDWEVNQKEDWNMASDRFSILLWGNEEEGYVHQLQRFFLEVEIPCRCDR